MKAIIYIFLALTSTMLHAQDVKLVNSTRQDWSGGIAGRHGSNYTFTIEFYNYPGQLMPDTIWVGQDAIVLNEDPPPNFKRMRKGDTVRFEIRANIHKDDYKDRYSLGEQQKEIPPPVNYKGVALLSYKYKHKQEYFIVSKIMHTMDPIAYP